MIGSLAMVATSLVRADGARTPLGQDVLVVAATATLAVATSWVGLTLASDLLRLREARSGSPVVETESPPLSPAASGSE